MSYSIPISALQHFAFCPRQCGYIHIERKWHDNRLTAEGNRLHDRVHSNESETRGKLRTERGVRVQSEQHGIHGQLDLLEINTKSLELTPVEYKRGKPKVSDVDRVQLCAQSMCLEEMRSVRIEQAAIWYWEKRQREWVHIDADLRQRTAVVISQVREMLIGQQLPKATYTKGCKSCSFVDECRPQLSDRSRSYINRLFEE